MINRKLGDVCNIKGGYAFKSTQFNATGIPLVRIGNITDNEVKIENVCIVENEIEKYRDFIINKGDVLVALSGATTGKFGIYTSKEPALLNQRVARIRVTHDMNNKYLYHYMNKLQHIILEKAMGAAQPNISTKGIEELEIYVPSIENQNKIADILDRAKELVDARKKQIEACDELIKSQFIEMFGSELDDTQVALYDICQKITDGTHQSPEFVQEGIPFLLVSNIVNNKINYDTKKFITRDEYEKLIKRTPIEIGDVLLTIVGSYGNPAIIMSDKEFCFQRHIAYMKPDREKIDSFYLHAALQTPYVRNQIDTKVKGIAQKTLNLSELKIIRVNLPALEKQKSFAEFVQQVDKLKFELEQSLIELENNFNALMQRAFKGELF